MKNRQGSCVFLPLPSLVCAPIPARWVCPWLAASWLLPTLLAPPTFMWSHRNFCSLPTRKPSRQEGAGFYVSFLGEIASITQGFPPSPHPGRQEGWAACMVSVLQWASGHGVSLGPLPHVRALPPHLCEGSPGVLLTWLGWRRTGSVAFYCHLKLEAFFALFGVLSGDGILILPLCSFDSGPPLRGSRTHSAPTYRHKGLWWPPRCIEYGACLPPATEGRWASLYLDTFRSRAHLQTLGLRKCPTWIGLGPRGSPWSWGGVIPIPLLGY